MVAHHNCMDTKATAVNVLSLVSLAGHPSSEIHTKLAVSTDDTSRQTLFLPVAIASVSSDSINLLAVGKIA